MNSQDTVGKLGIPLLAPLALGAGLEFQRIYLAQMGSPIGRKICDRLDKDERLKSYEGRSITSGVNAWSAFDRSHIATWWIWRANQVGPETADEELERYLSSETVKCIIAFWISGITVKEEIEFVDNIRLIPISNFLNYPDKFEFQSVSMGVSSLHSPRVMSVLCREVVTPKFADKREPSPFAIEELRRMGETCLLLNCLENVSCAAVYQTSYLAPDCPPGPFGGSGGSYTLDAPLRGYREHSKQDFEGVEEIFLGTQKLTKKKRESFLRAVSRLSRAKSVFSIEDFCLELGICSEMLLLSDAEPGKRQLSLSFRLRAAWYLADDIEERREMLAKFREVYDDRSTIAHGGSWSAERHKKIVNDRENRVALVSRLVRKIALKGYPDWNEVVLGAQK